MRRLRRPSSITMKAAIWPFPCTSFQVRPATELQIWQACCGGYCSRLQLVQNCRTSRRSFTASQKGLLEASGTGISFGIVSLRAPPDPLAVHRVLAADEFDIGRPTRRIDGERPLQGGNDVRRLAHPLAVETQGAEYLGHIDILRPHHRMREGIMSWAPETGAIAGKATIADVQHRDAELLAQQNLEVSQHVAEACLPGHCNGCPIWKCLLGGDGGGETEAQRGDVAPTQEPARDERVEDRTQLVAGVARFVRHERVAQVDYLHEIAIHAIWINRLLVGTHHLPVSGEPFVACRLHFCRKVAG